MARLNRRTNRQYDLTPAIAELTNNYLALEEDFQAFFPQLQAYIDNWHLNQAFKSKIN